MIDNLHLKTLRYKIIEIKTFNGNRLYDGSR